MKRNTLIAALAFTATAAPALATAQATEAVEFYNVSTNHYFITATATEAGIVDSGGAGPGWVRTGRAFPAWLSSRDAPANATPVCRFYSRGANSHFYTPAGPECESLKPAGTGWQYEGIAFYVHTPASGRCGSGFVAMDRLYNNGFATGEGANHRFVDDAALKQAMADSGWIPEGTAFCAVARATGTNANLSATTRAFRTLAGTFGGNAKWEVQAAGREDKVRRDIEVVAADTGAFTATGYGCTFIGTVTRGDGFRSLFTGTATATGCTDPAFDGMHDVTLERFGEGVLKVRFKRENADGEVKVEATTVAEREPAVGSFEGNWSGIVKWEAEAPNLEIEANQLLELTVSPAGAIGGAGFGCTFSGTVDGQVVATGCTQAIFNGTYGAELESEGAGRIRIELKRETMDTKVEIEGVLIGDGATGGPPDDDDDDPPTSVVGSWSGPLSFEVGDTEGSGTISFTIAAGGSFTGTGAGCTFGGALVLSANAASVSSGSITASGCANPAMNGIYADIEIEGEDGGKLEIEMERENGLRVQLKAKVTRTG